jgi:hypothetical protein
MIKFCNIVSYVMVTIIEITNRNISMVADNNKEVNVAISKENI